MDTGVQCRACAGKSSWPSANGTVCCAVCHGVGFVPSASGPRRPESITAVHADADIADSPFGNEAPQTPPLDGRPVVDPPPVPPTSWTRQARRRGSHGEALDTDPLRNQENDDDMRGITVALGGASLIPERRFFCPIPRCNAHDCSRHSGWTSFDSLRNHVDAHLLLQLPGRPTVEWMNSHNLHPCSHCTRLVSKRFLRHRTCQAQLNRLDGAIPHFHTNQALSAENAELVVLDEMPDLTEICSTPIATRDLVGVGLLPRATKVFWRLVSAVVQHNRTDAWDNIGTSEDSPSHKKARFVWLELWVFSKTCLAILPGSQQKKRRNANILANRLERWISGERGSLWEEAKRFCNRKGPYKAPVSPKVQQKRRETAATDLARRGLPGQAVQRLTGPGLAPNTAAVENIMRSKFIEPLLHQPGSSRPPAPPANELSCELVLRAAKAFKRGVGSGPSGLQPDFVRQALLGNEGVHEEGLVVLTAFINLLADGRAPRAMQPYLGGAKGTAGDKTSKTGEQDVRPLCSGEYFRCLTSRALLFSELETLREHLLPHQLAVGVAAGQEVMAHATRQWRDAFRDDLDRIAVTLDESNAYNEFDRHTFLRRLSEVCPGISRWLEYIYPTDAGTFVFYQGKIICSRAGGQQGCPLMMACHAMVQRVLWESLGLVATPAGSHIQPPRLSPPARLDLAPTFADDGLLQDALQRFCAVFITSSSLCHGSG